MRSKRKRRITGVYGSVARYGPQSVCQRSVVVAFALYAREESFFPPKICDISSALSVTQTK